MSYGNRIFEKGPDGRFRLASDRTDSRQEANKEPEEKKITDSAVSFLFALKFYPFRAPFLSLVPRESDNELDEKADSDGESRQFDADAPIDGARDDAKSKNHLGVVALGLDFGLPGDSGFGYGEEWPFKNRLRKSAVVDDDENSINVDAFDDEKRSAT